MVKERMEMVKGLTGGGEEVKKKERRLNAEGEEEEEDEEELLEEMLGFTGFGTTKGQAVADNQSGAAAGAAGRHKGRKYRQYMNRKGGFNRPLQKME